MSCWAKRRVAVGIQLWFETTRQFTFLLLHTAPHRRRMNETDAGDYAIGQSHPVTAIAAVERSKQPLQTFSAPLKLQVTPFPPRSLGHSPDSSTTIAIPLTLQKRQSSSRCRSRRKSNRSSRRLRLWRTTPTASITTGQPSVSPLPLLSSFQSKSTACVPNPIR